MEDGKGDGGQRESEDTDELLFTGQTFSTRVSASSLVVFCLCQTLRLLLRFRSDLEDESGVFGQPSPLKLDHCDLLLDAIDAQLSRLQVSMSFFF